MDTSPETRRAAGLYLNLLKACLTRIVFPDRSLKRDLSSTQEACFADRFEGTDWPTEAETMAGLRRLNNLETCVLRVIESDIRGDLVDIGAWRGGTAILMRAVLNAYGDCRRRVIVADAFDCGAAGGEMPHDQATGNSNNPLHPYRSVPLEAVRGNFARYGLLDEYVTFLVGSFKETLPTAPVESVAVLRISVDTYELTMDSLLHLYDKVSDGGFVIIDGYGRVGACRTAVSDFRRTRGIAEPICRIDWTGVFWRKGDSRPGLLSTVVRKPVDLSDFNEEDYVRANSDVADALKNGSLKSGLEHFLLYGQYENRPRR